MKNDAEKAMPDVNALVTEHGLDVVAYCIARLKDDEKRRREIAALKRQIATIEKKIS